MINESITHRTFWIYRSINFKTTFKKIKLTVTKFNNLSIPGQKDIAVIDLKKIIIKDFDLVIHTAWENLNNYNSKEHLKKILPSNIKFLKN